MRGLWGQKGPLQEDFSEEEALEGCLGWDSRALQGQLRDGSGKFSRRIDGRLRVRLRGRCPSRASCKLYHSRSAQGEADTHTAGSEGDPGAHEGVVQLLQIRSEVLIWTPRRPGSSTLQMRTCTPAVGTDVGRVGSRKVGSMAEAE